MEGVHEAAIAVSGRLQPDSGESGRNLLLCSLTRAVNHRKDSNRPSRDGLQSAGGPADLLLCSLIWTGPSQN